MLIYVIEDDTSIRELIQYALKTADFQTVGFEDSSKLFTALESEKPDLILLDIMLPGEDGLSILKKLRSSSGTAHLPVMMLTAKGSEFDKVNALDLGADDYMTKPFGVMELISRSKALIRRTSSKKDDEVLINCGITMDLNRRTVKIDEKEILLTFKEFELLHYLMQNQGLVLSREKVMQVVWGFDFEGESRTVDMHIKLLRSKLQEKGELIKTIRGVGYKLAE